MIISSSPPTGPLSVSPHVNLHLHLSSFLGVWGGLFGILHIYCAGNVTMSSTVLNFQLGLFKSVLPTVSFLTISKDSRCLV